MTDCDDEARISHCELPLQTADFRGNDGYATATTTAFSTDYTGLADKAKDFLRNDN
jgi:hypothetical protein